MKAPVPGFVVAGPGSGAGKTLVAAGLVAAFKARGLKVQPFKAGPRPMDVGILATASGRMPYLLDLWNVPRDVVVAAYARRAAGADLAVVEGTRGLFDDAGSSTAELAEALGLPVILVVDAAGLAESAAAVVRGFAAFGGGRIAGVLCNRVRSPRHLDVLRAAVAAGGDAEFLGGLPRHRDFDVKPADHDWAVAGFAKALEPALPALVEKLSRAADLDRLLAIAGSAATPPAPAAKPDPDSRVKIAIPRDAAFPFVDDLDLEALRHAGVEPVFFSPLKDSSLPSGLGGLWLGGGLGESSAEELELNTALRGELREAVEGGLPVVAGCGGVEWMVKTLVGNGVRAWEMAGLLPGEVSLPNRLPSWGRVEVEARADSFLLRQGERYRGYDFRPSVWTGDAGPQSPWVVNRPGDAETRAEGWSSPTLHASFVHVSFAASPVLAERFADAARKFLGQRAPKRKTRVRRRK